ncbi:polysaccharide biosynthesis/export family protein [Roseimicrobium gellanilyticum]|nr:polysaccharide biosynthesis/export family protein [Roseimicrobium gellanilyticum]
MAAALLAVMGGGSSMAQDASLVKAEEHACISPSERFRIDQYHTTGGDIWDWEFWVSRKGGAPPVKLSTGARDPAMYGAGFSFHPSEKWLLRTQKTGSGDNVVVLYRITKQETFVRTDAGSTLDELAWAEFDRVYSLAGDATQRYHAGCGFLGWEPDGETLRLRLTAAHCGEAYRADWTVHYHLKTKKFFFASDDRAHNKRHGLIWKPRGKLAVSAHDDLRLLRAGDVVSVQFTSVGPEKHMLTVGQDGFVKVPYIGKVRAAGRTCRQLANLIRVEIEKQYFG